MNFKLPLAIYADLLVTALEYALSGNHYAILLRYLSARNSGYVDMAYETNEEANIRCALVALQRSRPRQVKYRFWKTIAEPFIVSDAFVDPLACLVA